MTAVVKVTGLKETEAALDEMTSATANNAIRRALIKAAAPIEAAGEARAPVAQGLLKAGIITSTQLTKSQRKQNKKRAAATVYVGVGGRRGPFAHLVEFGTSRIAPVGFMRQAFDTQVGRTVSIFIRELKAEIEKAKERARRKAARAAKG